MILSEDSPIDIFENEDRKRIIVINGIIFFILLPPIIYMIPVRF
jgi:hypothetical protein